MRMISKFLVFLLLAIQRLLKGKNSNVKIFTYKYKYDDDDEDDDNEAQLRNKFSISNHSK